jgi:hypothetical protein
VLGMGVDIVEREAALAEGSPDSGEGSVAESHYRTIRVTTLIR